MEMAGKHSDHYFCRWQAKIVTTINFFSRKKWKKRKVLRIAWFGEKIDQKNILEKKCLEFSDLARKLIRKTVRQFPPPDMCAEKFPLVSMGGRAEGLAIADLGARTPIGASGIFSSSSRSRFSMKYWVSLTLQHWTKSLKNIQFWKRFLYKSQNVLALFPFWT